MEGVLAAVAQFDNDVRAERTVDGMQAALQRGRWTFQAPLGYRKLAWGNGPSMEPDPEVAPLVLQAFELFATGSYPKARVLETVTALGLRTRRGKKVSPQEFDRILRNPLYEGRMVVPGWGVDCRGDFEPIVSREMFRTVQAILSGRRPLVTPHIRNHPDFPLRRFVHCGRCERPLTGSWSKGRRHHYPYYRCPNARCKGVNIRKSELEGRFVTLLEHVQPRPLLSKLAERSREGC